MAIGIGFALTKRPHTKASRLLGITQFNSIKETAMQWTTPAYTDLRFGFEITMYIANR